MLIRLARVSITKDSARKKKKGKKGRGGEKDSAATRKTTGCRLKFHATTVATCSLTRRFRDNVISTKGGIGESVISSDSRDDST